jgi:hypothetical protein
VYSLMRGEEDDTCRILRKFSVLNTVGASPYWWLLLTLQYLLYLSSNYGARARDILGVMRASTLQVITFSSPNRWVKCLEKAGPLSLTTCTTRLEMNEGQCGTEEQSTRPEPTSQS